MSMKSKTKNMRDIAQAAGVSIATVSNVLSGQGAFKVSPKTEAKVLATCKQLGYEPNVHAKRMFAKRSNVLGLIFPLNLEDVVHLHIPDYVFAGIVQGATYIAMNHGYQIFLSPERFIESKEYIKLYRSRAVDGFLIWGAVCDSPWIDEISDCGIPFVLVQSIPDNAERKKYPYVIPNDFSITKFWVDHLVSLGHRHIGHITGFQASSVGVARFEGFKSGMQEHGLYDESLVMLGDYAYDCGVEGARNILKRCPETTAIICAGSPTAWGAIEYVQGQGKSVPEDISIVGADGIKVRFGQTLSAFYTNTIDLGEQATELLLKNIKHQQPLGEQQLVLSSELDMGQTVGPAKK